MKKKVLVTKEEGNTKTVAKLIDSTIGLYGRSLLFLLTNFDINYFLMALGSLCGAEHYFKFIENKFV